MNNIEKHWEFQKEKRFRKGFRASRLHPNASSLVTEKYFAMGFLYGCLSPTECKNVKEAIKMSEGYNFTKLYELKVKLNSNIAQIGNTGI